MADRIFVRQTDPKVPVLSSASGDYIKAEGDWVPNTIWIQRRIKEGALRQVSPPAAPEPRPSRPAKAPRPAEPEAPRAFTPAKAEIERERRVPARPMRPAAAAAVNNPPAQVTNPFGSFPPKDTPGGGSSGT
jgi:hypothetical protein